MRERGETAAEAAACRQSLTRVTAIVLAESLPPHQDLGSRSLLSTQVNG